MQLIQLVYYFMTTASVCQALYVLFTSLLQSTLHGCRPLLIKRIFSDDSLKWSLTSRSFSVAGPRIWNSLPASLRQPDIKFGHYKRLLKARPRRITDTLISMRRV